jgi:hypothetical protein
MSLRQESSGREEEPRTQKPFVGTPRVANPASQSRASRQKRVLRGDGRPSPRSVDSQVKGRVIEPRKLKTSGAFAVDISGGRVGRVSLGPTRRDRSDRGRRARAMTIRVPREPGRPDRFHREFRLGNRMTNSPEPTIARRDRWEQTTTQPVVSPSEGNEARRDGRSGVGASHSTDEAGEPLRRDPVEGRGRRVRGDLET